MRILVGVKRVVDYAVRVRVKPDGKGVDLSNVKMSMNPFCEVALEEAVRLKESGAATEVVAVSVGPTKGCTETLRSALAVGADRAVLVAVEDVRTDSGMHPLSVAQVLAAVCDAEEPGLVLTGKQSIDGDFGCTGAMLA
eukprot:CAMPEP_0194325112 /NCGR_PEP_ID=MMETSP0171-20130528/29050_1 /TAXON_ID=218684 /ORGANISM="Corethron pennatum, Strain L29A3" /LENGTH=138 /DNA_ID=CAMNT_0039084143 /DNA_START=197 /DNA_END=610 /DNA_ORIENTATION=+